MAMRRMAVPSVSSVRPPGVTVPSVSSVPSVPDLCPCGVGRSRYVK